MDYESVENTKAWNKFAKNMNVNGKKNGKRKEPRELKNLDNDKEKESRNRILRTELVVRYFFFGSLFRHVALPTLCTLFECLL